MNKIRLLSGGAWVLGLLVGLFAWLSPDSRFFPSPALGLGVMGAGILLLLLWALAVGFHRDAPHPSFVAHLGAIVPLHAAILALILAARGWLPHPSLPLLLIVVIGLAAAQTSRRLGGEPMGRAAEFGIALLVIAALSVLVPVLGLAADGGAVWQMTDPDFARPLARIRASHVLDRYRPTPRPEISADGAGVALQAIAATGGGERDPLLTPAVGTVGQPWLPDTGLFVRWSADSVLRYAHRGLTPAERSWLERLARHPARGLLDTVAYAAALDPWVTLRLPLPAELTATRLPIPRMMAVRNAARMRLLGATLAATSGKPALADSIIRSTIGFGLRLRDDADLLVTSLIGATIAREAGLAMAVQWRALGKTLMADSMVAALTTGEGVPSDSIGETSAALFRATLISSIEDTTSLRAMRWEHLAQLGLSRCTDLREMLYGQSAAIREVHTAAAATMNRSAQETAVFTVVARGIDGREGIWHPALALLPAIWVLGERSAGCAQVVMGAGM